MQEFERPRLNSEYEDNRSEMFLPIGDLYSPTKPKSPKKASILFF